MPRPATPASTTPRWCWSPSSWSATPGRCCPDGSEATPAYDFLYAVAHPGVRDGHRLPLPLLHLVPRATCAGWSPRSWCPTWSSRPCSRCSAPWSAARTSTPLCLDPHWPMWYLSVAVPVAAGHAAAEPGAGSRWPLAVVVCLLGGRASGDVLDLTRALGLLPFFTLGLVVTREHLRPARRAAGAGRWRVGLLRGGRRGGAPSWCPTVGTEWLYWRLELRRARRRRSRGRR